MMIERVPACKEWFSLSFRPDRNLHIPPTNPRGRFGGEDLQVASGRVPGELELQRLLVLGVALEGVHELGLGAVVADGLVG